VIGKKDMHIKDWPEGDRPPGNAFGEMPGGSEWCRAAGYSVKNRQAGKKCHSPCERNDKQPFDFINIRCQTQIHQEQKPLEAFLAKGRYEMAQVWPT